MDNRTYFHLAAFRASLATGTTYLAIAGITDNVLTKASSGAYIAPANTKIRFGYAFGTDINEQRLDTPAVRAVGKPQMAPIDDGLTVASPSNLVDFGPFGVRPEQADEFQLEGFHDNAGSVVNGGLLWLQFGRREPASGQRYRIRYTAAITASAGTWQSGAITFNQTLPSGTYQIVGMNAWGTNLVAARLIFPGGGWRPGVLAMNSDDGIPRREWENDTMGVFGEFDSVATPALEIYTEGANTAQEGWLDMIRVGNL